MNIPSIAIAEHPLLDLRLLVSEFPQPLSELESSPALVQLLTLEASVPLSSSDELRRDVRDLLRHGGFKPTGRNKPAAEFLIKAAREGILGSINPAVDICNAVSLHSGLPISVVDLDLVAAPMRIAIADSGTSYVFNRSGQTIDVSGLLCLFDNGGAAANAVRDSQRTKTTETTRRTLSCIWGTRAQAGRSDATAEWYQSLLSAQGAVVEQLSLPG